MSKQENYNELIEKMIKEQLEARDITDKAVLNAMRKVQRHLFVPERYRKYAYTDGALPIEHEQTISQPYVVAYMTQVLQIKKTDKVLEIGTGSGYQAAILAELADNVYTIERIPELSISARELLEKLGYKNIYFKIGNGTKGWPEEAPFDKIMITAATPSVPPSLLAQLKEDGLLIAPVGDIFHQELELYKKTKTGIEKKTLFSVVFVKLIGEEGFKG